MENYLVQLLNFLDANVKVHWDMINTGLPPVGVKVNLRVVAPGSKSSILSTAQHCIVLQNQVLQQTWEVKWLPLGTHRSTGWPTWQWKVLKFLGLWLPFFFFFFALLGSLENDPLSSACLLSQIQVDQEITVRVLCDSSRALGKRKIKIRTLKIYNFYSNRFSEDR